MVDLGGQFRGFYDLTGFLCKKICQPICIALRLRDGVSIISRREAKCSAVIEHHVFRLLSSEWTIVKNYELEIRN